MDWPPLPRVTGGKGSFRRDATTPHKQVQQNRFMQRSFLASSALICITSFQLGNGWSFSCSKHFGFFGTKNKTTQRGGAGGTESKQIQKSSSITTTTPLPGNQAKVLKPFKAPGYNPMQTYWGVKSSWTHLPFLGKRTGLGHKFPQKWQMPTLQTQIHPGQHQISSEIIIFFPSYEFSLYPSGLSWEGFWFPSLWKIFFHHLRLSNPKPLPWSSLKHSPKEVKRWVWIWHIQEKEAPLMNNKLADFNQCAKRCAFNKLFPWKNLGHPAWNQNL